MRAPMPLSPVFLRNKQISTFTFSKTLHLKISTNLLTVERRRKFKQNVAKSCMRLAGCTLSASGLQERNLKGACLITALLKISTNLANSELKLFIVISFKLYRTKIAFILLWINWRVSAVVCLNNGAGGLGKPDSVLPTARHFCGVSSDLCCPGVKPLLATRFCVKRLV